MRTCRGGQWRWRVREMMKKMLAVLAVAVPLLVLPVAAAAGDAGKIGGFVGGGFGLPMGTLGDVAKLGFGLTGGVGYNVNERLSVGAALDFSQFSPKLTKEAEDAGAEADGKLSLLGGGVYARYLLTPKGTQPYLIGRLALVNFKAKIDVLFEGDVVETADESETKPAVAVGGGVDFPIGKASKGFVEGTYNLGFTADEKTRWITVRAGIRFGS
jgi:opacity protein-like surface antigen